MKGFAAAALTLAALGAAGPWMGRGLAQGAFGGRGPGLEAEPNDRLTQANALGTMPAAAPLAVWGEIAHRRDGDVYRIDVLEPTSLDLRIVTGATLMPFSGPGGSGGERPVHSGGFLPVLALYGPDGRLVAVHVSEAPNLLLLDLPVPLYNTCFFAQVSGGPGALGPYGLQVAVHAPAG